MLLSLARTTPVDDVRWRPNRASTSGVEIKGRRTENVERVGRAGIREGRSDTATVMATVVMTRDVPGVNLTGVDGPLYSCTLVCDTWYIRTLVSDITFFIVWCAPPVSGMCNAMFVLCFILVFSSTPELLESSKISNRSNSIQHYLQSSTCRCRYRSNRRSVQHHQSFQISSISFKSI